VAPPKLLDQLCSIIRMRNYSPRTEKIYRSWVERYIRFHGLQHPKNLNSDHIVAFMVHLTEEAELSPSARNQARAAISFLYRNVLHQPDVVGGLGPVAKNDPTFRVILSEREIRRVLARVAGRTGLMLRTLYGSGIRVSECRNLRVQDISLDRRTVRVQRGKGNKSRIAILPHSLVQPYRDHISWLRRQHEIDLRGGSGAVPLPHSLGRRSPSEHFRFPWQWLFPGPTVHYSAEIPAGYRKPVGPSKITREFQQAVAQCQLTKHVTLHSLRHSFASHLHDHGTPIPRIQELLGHSDVRVTMRYLHAIQAARSTVSPLDRFDGYEMEG